MQNSPLEQSLLLVQAAAATASPLKTTKGRGSAAAEPRAARRRQAGRMAKFTGSNGVGPGR